MDTQDPRNNFPELIYKYLSGNASDAEVQTLEAWVLADSKNKEEFVAFKKAWMLGGMKQSESTVNVDKLWEQTAGQVFKEAKNVKLEPKQNRRIWLRIAAAIAFLLVASIWIFQNFGDSSSMLVQAIDQVEEFDLPDGSKITLNQSSSLSFNAEGEDGKRKVDLKGDAFFDVKRDEIHPFVIQTEGVEIEVLGTSFYVDGRADEETVEVIVQSGLVAVRNGSMETILKPNEKAVFQKQSKQLTKVQNEDPNYRSIQTNKLTFENTKLDKVVFALNRHFYKNISFENPALKECEINAVFENQSLDAILKIIEETIRGVKVRRLGDSIVLSGLGCD